MTFLAHFLRKIGLQQQISAVVGLGIVCIALLTSVASSIQSSHQIDTLLRTQGERIAANLAHGSALALVLQAPENARGALDITLSFPDVLQAEIRDTSGAAIVVRTRSGAPLELTDARQRPASGDTALLESETGDVWRFVAPVVAAASDSPFDAEPGVSQVLGFVRIVQSKETLSHKRAEVFVVNMVLATVFTVIMLLLIRFLTARLTSPLHALSEALSRAHEGGSGIVADEYSGSREITVMAKAFNSMMAALAEREQRFRSLTSLSSDWYWERDEEDRLVYISRGFQEITGLDPSSLIGTRRDERTGFVYSESFAHCQACVARREPFRDLEWQLLDANGNLLHGLISGEPIFDRDKRFKGYRGIGKNTTSAKLAEQAQLSAARLRKMVEHLPVGAVYLEHERLELNGTFEHLTGFSREEITTRDSYFAMMYGDEADKWRAGYDKERAAGFPRKMEGPLRRKDGTRRWIEFSAYLDEHIEVWLLHDMTERREVQKVLKQTMLEQQAILENASVAIAFTKNRIIESCNREMEVMMRLGPGELLGKPTSCVYPSELAFAELSAMAIPILAGGRQLDTEVELMRQDGGRFWARMRAKAVDPADQAKGTIFICEDITERKQAEADIAQALAEQRATNNDLHAAMQELRQAQSQLVQSEKMAALGQLVAGVAHEINTPIGAVKSSGRNIADALQLALANLPRLFRQLDDADTTLFMRLIGHRTEYDEVLSTREERVLVRRLTQQLDNDGVPQAQQRAATLVQLNAHNAYRDYLPLMLGEQRRLVFETAFCVSTIASNTANINVAVERVAKIVFALKAFSRIDLAGEMVEADLREGLETVLTIYQNQIKQHTELVRKYDDIPKVRCLPDELNQVWTNLIHNALQAMQHRGTLTLSIRREGGYAVVSIGDSGSGIDPAIRGRIFDAFFTTKPAGEGSGLGLDIVRKIIDKHHGRIDLHSEVDVGTTFHVYLPFQAELQ